VSRNSQNHFEEFRYPNSFSQQYALQYVNQLSRIILSHWHFWGGLSELCPVHTLFEGGLNHGELEWSSLSLRHLSDRFQFPEAANQRCEPSGRMGTADGPVEVENVSINIAVSPNISHFVASHMKKEYLYYILFAMCELLLLLYTQPPTPINIPSLNSVECIGNLYRMVPIKSPVDQHRGSSAGFPQRADPAAVFRQWGHVGQRQEVWLGMELGQGWANDVVQEV
jgi:hypothetical protein